MNTGIFKTRALAVIGSASVALCLGMAASSASAEDIRGVAKADFAANKLSIPCVYVSNIGGPAEGQYFDVTLNRRGNSMNFEVSTAEVEDPAFCKKVADYAESLENGTPMTPALLVQCVSTAARTSVTVNGTALPSGSYSAKLTSGVNTATAPVQAPVSGKLTYRFDSDAAAILTGATQIPTTFVSGGSVKVDIINDATLQTTLTATTACTAG